MQYHPDMNKSPGAEEKFKEVSAAYEVCSALWLQLKPCRILELDVLSNIRYAKPRCGYFLFLFFPLSNMVEIPKKKCKSNLLNLVSQHYPGVIMAFN
jgi:hypothetical protein